jgi:hypothetical protein
MMNSPRAFICDGSKGLFGCADTGLDLSTFTIRRITLCFVKREIEDATADFPNFKRLAPIFQPLAP